ncbi:hypothetical protein AHAS_Ahas17G0056200 [Arachis hypogaea]
MYLGHLKSYVRNKAKSEGSIAEGYVVEEALTFCSGGGHLQGHSDDQVSVRTRR